LISLYEKLENYNATTNNTRITDCDNSKLNVFLIKPESSNYFSISILNHFVPLKLIFLNVNSAKICAYISKSIKRPNRECANEIFENISSLKIYKLYFGNHYQKKFAIEKAYINLVSNIECNIKIVYSFGIEGIYIKGNKHRIQKNDLPMIISSKKNIEDKLNYYFQNPYEMIKLFNKVKEIKKKKIESRKALTKINLVEKNRSSKDSYSDFLTQRNNQWKMFSIRHKSASDSRNQVLRKYLVTKTLQVKRQELINLRVTLIQRNIIIKLNDQKKFIMKMKLSWILMSQIYVVMKSSHRMYRVV